jgi:hypothetical protein
MIEVRKRVVLHFPGFEPLDAVAHRARYARASRQSASVWGYQTDIGDLQPLGTAPFFDVTSTGAAWRTESRVHIVDHDDLVASLNGRILPIRLALGYLAGLRVAVGGGLTGYFRHAWRFGLFFVFPFLLLSTGLLASLLIATVPQAFGMGYWSPILGLPAALLFLLYVVLPFIARFYTLHLLSDWEMAVAMADLKGLGAQAWLDRRAANVRQALNEPADEYLITSHSMGSSVAAHVVGLLLEREPALFEGKRVVFTTLGSAILQCALLRSAKVLRARVGLIAGCAGVTWLDVQCLTDAIHFYKTKVVALCGHQGARQADIVFIRFKTMLSDVHYKKIRGDFLRVHRQYVLGPDVKAPFDFGLMTAGPLPAADFRFFTPGKLPVV